MNVSEIYKLMQAAHPNEFHKAMKYAETFSLRYDLGFDASEELEKSFVVFAHELILKTNPVK